MANSRGPEDFSAEARRLDEDRWLAARFAGPGARAALDALYVLHDDIARTADRVREPALGEIRLRWWRDQVEAVGGSTSPHPALAALAPALTAAPDARGALLALIEARARDLDATPFVELAEIETYADATAGNLMRAAARLCGAEAAPAIAPAALAWGLNGLARAAPFWRAKGRERLGPGVSERALAQAALAALRRIGPVPAALFPAIGYATLTRAYARGRAPGGLERRARVLLAAARGRL